jgi:hypothetical protein
LPLSRQGTIVTNFPDPVPPKLSEHSLLEQRERAAADLVKVLEQVRAEIARARALLDRIGREQTIDLHRGERQALLAPRIDAKAGSTSFNGDQKP